MKLDDIKKLSQKKYREQFGHFLVEGEHLALELQRAADANPALLNSALYVTEAFLQKQGGEWRSPFATHIVSERQLAQLADTKTPQGIVAVVPVAALANPAGAAAAARAIYLHEVQDPGNLGTILRTLAWFGGFRCLLSPGSVDPFNPKVVRASMGAIFRVPLELDIDATALRSRFARIAALDMQGEALPSNTFADFDCYLFGNEARGVPRPLLTSLQAHPFTIAGSGAIESLNLASVVNICVYELSAKS